MREQQRSNPRKADRAALPVILWLLVLTSLFLATPLIEACVLGHVQEENSP
ncbi:hypothetical protein ACPA5B_08980 [Pseudomonas solani]|uniref:hypothetical protein n=1 Tax=Pseudomonas solani TaxID=2731552 RepID=UPI003C2F3D7E